MFFGRSLLPLHAEDIPKSSKSSEKMLEGLRPQTAPFGPAKPSSTAAEVWCTDEGDHSTGKNPLPPEFGSLHMCFCYCALVTIHVQKLLTRPKSAFPWLQGGAYQGPDVEHVRDPHTFLGATYPLLSAQK